MLSSIFVKLAYPKPPLPPSPKSYPFLGNIAIIPEKDEYVAYRDWSRKLESDVIHIKVPGRCLIIVNSAHAIPTILERNTNAYRSRSNFPLITPDLFDLTRHTAFLPYGERWDDQRQLMHHSLRRRAERVFFSIQTKHARRAATEILDRPEDYIAIIRGILGSQILSCIYGYEVTSPDDEIIKLVESASNHIRQAVSPPVRPVPNQGTGRISSIVDFLVDLIPGLKKIPSWTLGADWEPIAKEWSREFIRTITLPYEYTVSQMAAGTAVPSVLSQILRSFSRRGKDITDEQKDRAMWTAGSIYTVAVDSLHGTLQIIILLMTIYQDVQTKAQTEIDGVTKGKRLPEISDMKDMPYTRSIILESLRWLPTSPLRKFATSDFVVVPTYLLFQGIPRVCEEDDTYNGYTIPKGALVIGNIWAIHRDESRYHDPESFLPERFMDPDTPEPVTFGFGRRICPGMHFAHSSLFIYAATILSVFDIRPVQDEQGEDIIPKAELVPGALAFNPAPFRCTITPRSEMHRQLLVNNALVD